MANKRQEAEAMRGDVPSTVARSDDKAVRTYKKTLDSAEESYGDGERARRTAMSALKHTHEKVGDHWEPKEEHGPSDRQAAKSTPQSGHAGPTAGGVDANASKSHLQDLARRLGIRGRSSMNKDELVEAIGKANDNLTAAARSGETK